MTEQPRGTSIRMIRALSGAAVLSGFLIVFVYQATLPRIAENRRRALEQAIFQVVPGAQHRITFVIGPDGQAQPEGQAKGEGLGIMVYAGYDGDGKLAGIAIEAAGQGYQDVIRILYGYSPQKECVTGMIVLDSRETPGLGDKIETDERFLKNFECLDVRLNQQQTALLHSIESVKRGEKTQAWQIDAISGATISSKAVSKMLDESTRQLLPLLAANLKRIREAGEEVSRQDAKTAK